MILNTNAIRLTIYVVLSFFLSQTWICNIQAEKKTFFKIGVPFNNPAFSFQNDPENLVQGYSVDILNILCQKMSVSPRFLIGRDDDLLYALSQGVIDIACGVEQKEDLQNQFINLEISIYIKRYTFSYKLTAQPKVLKPFASKTIVMVGSSDYVESRLLVSNVNLIRARSVKEALSLVNSGAAQEYVGYSDRLATYLIGKYDLQNVRQAGVTISRFPLNLIISRNHEDVAAELRAALGNAIQSGELGKVREKWLGESYGSYLWEVYGLWMTLGILIALIMVVGVVTWNQALKVKVDDITNDLQLSEERYRQLIESSPDFVFLVNQSGHIKMANQSMDDCFGIPQDQQPMISIFELVCKSDYDNCHKFLKQLFIERTASAELKMEKRQNQQIYVEIAAAMLPERKDNERLACCFARDLTMRKLMEKELIKSDRLSTIGKMAAGVAHEVNNPLGIIASHTEDLLSGELNSFENEESLKIIQRNIVRAAGIIDALLGQASSGPPQMATLDLTELLEGCITFLRPRMKKIKLEAEFISENYWVKGDESQLQQVFINLLINAVESLEENGIVKVWIENGFIKNLGYHSVWIEDNGSGIDSNDRERIFDPFFTKGKARGVGLGLFVSERIINKHYGTMRAAESSIGGAAIVASLPAVKKGEL